MRDWVVFISACAEQRNNYNGKVILRFNNFTVAF